ncbi:hypothetical protein COLO4_33489 [Corchorus olitorius]|uniref:Uncharacterized protein n=1 Tax=Corchorus olitorius TaxID=93759 RepID=A0A1R3GTC4_9ROSI|nr:hypothetical protein COLO4_33489 [Corchorus olitorius]
MGRFERKVVERFLVFEMRSGGQGGRMSWRGG